jgi:hypothetical protein
MGLNCKALWWAIMAASPMMSGQSRVSNPTVVVREIVDRQNGDRWLLMRDGKNPGGPGRLVRVPLAIKSAEAAGTEQQTPVIHAGDRIVVEEHTPVAEAWLEAVAQAPALRGAGFWARLQIGGKLVRAVALGPGRAQLVVSDGSQP